MNVEAQHRLTYVLAAVCGVLALLALALWLGVGRGYGWLAPDPSAAPRLPDPGKLKQLSFQMPPFDHYIEITQRPLFSDDRKPIAPDAEAQPEEQAAPAVPLRIALTGVVVTPQVKVAMLRDLTTNKSISLREGMPLPGNQAGWTLVEIQPRKIVVADAGDKTTEVELTAPGSNPAPPGAGNAAPAQKAPAPQTPQQKAADDLRQRIEARRKELREQAEKLRQQNAQPGRQPAEKHQ